MRLRVCKKQGRCIFGLNSFVSAEIVNELRKNVITDEYSDELAIDLLNVTDICTDFIQFLREASKKKAISLFNIPSEVFAILNLTKSDKFAKIYVSEYDYFQGKHQLIKRRFRVI